MPFGLVERCIVAALLVITGIGMISQFKSVVEPGFEDELGELAEDINSLIARGGPTIERELEIPANVKVDFDGYQLKVDSNLSTRYISGQPFAIPLVGPLLDSGKYMLRFEFVDNRVEVSVVEELLS